MTKKRKKQEVPEDLIPNEGPFFPKDADEKYFNDTSNFIDDTPYVRPINEKFDKDGLYLMHHYIICHLAIKAGYFHDDRFLHTKDKCLQYFTDRKLFNIQVKPETFYKSYSDFENLYFKAKYDIDSKEIVRNKYLSTNLIERVKPFIEQWYPYAVLWIQTLYTVPYILDADHYYWVFREIQVKHPQSMQDFRKEHCRDISYDTFKSLHKRNYKKQIPSDIKSDITPYLEAHYRDVLETNK